MWFSTRSVVATQISWLLIVTSWSCISSAFMLQNQPPRTKFCAATPPSEPVYHFPANLTDTTVSIHERRVRRRRAQERLCTIDSEHKRGEYMMKSTKMDIPTSATLDRLVFSSPDPPFEEVTSEAVRGPPKIEKRRRWYVELPGNDGGTLIDIDQRGIARRNETMLDRMATAHIYFHHQEMMEQEDPAVRIASLLAITPLQAKHLISKAPALANLQGTVLAQRCVELSVLLKCTPQRLAFVVKRCPSILTYRTTTLERKLVELHQLLSCHQEREVVQSSTISIANRVPTLLVSNIQGTLQRRAHELQLLLFGFDVCTETNSRFEKILHRCPELLLYDITRTIAPKIAILNVSTAADWWVLFSNLPHSRIVSMDSFAFPSH
jgi:hypothetical protein